MVVSYRLHKIKIFQITIVLVLLSAAAFSQSIKFGLGAKGYLNRVDAYDQLTFKAIDNTGDTLFMALDDIKFSSSGTIPIFLRYQSRKRWWVQLDYDFERWTADIYGSTNNTEYYLDAKASQDVENAWNDYAGTEFTTYEQYYNHYYNIFYSSYKTQNEIPYKFHEEMQYNRISLSAGSSFFNKRKLKVFYGLGLSAFFPRSYYSAYMSGNSEWYSEGFRGLVYDNENFENKYKLTKNFPRLNSSLVTFNSLLGVENHRFRLGFEMRYSANIQAERMEESSGEIINEYYEHEMDEYNYLVSYGLFFNYTISDYKLNKKIDEEKLMTLKPEVLGKYKAKPDRWHFGLSVDIPSFFNKGYFYVGGSYMDDEYNTYDDDDVYRIDSILAEDPYLPKVYPNGTDKDNFLIESYIYEYYIDDNNEIDTNIYWRTLFLEGGDINTVIRTPKISGLITYVPFRNISVDFRPGYQNISVGINAYETKYGVEYGSETRSTRQLMFLENFHEVSMGVNINTMFPINATSKAGCHIGFNANLWIPGKYRQEAGGANDSELLKEFHEYLIYGSDQQEWNYNENEGATKGVFSKMDYYAWMYDEESEIYDEDWYHMDFSDYLMNTTKKRLQAEMRLGLDYYFNNMKFSAYSEFSVSELSYMYSSFVSVGMSFALYLN
ncbi:MAG: hypothetical protein C0594_13490 [Marinilabiliales bacterium]|nr:MAG: hypothetical protein C0594_13490 [Marinilabiliales bacterium]